MGSVCKDDNNHTSNGGSSVSADTYFIKNFVSSNCKTEEVEPGKLIRKCEKIEQLIKDCGKPSEVVQCNREYTEEVVTEQVVKGSFFIGPSRNEPVAFSKLSSDIDAFQNRSNIDANEKRMQAMQRSFDAAEERLNGFFSALDHLYDRKSSSLSSTRRSIPVDGEYSKEASYKTC